MTEHVEPGHQPTAPDRASRSAGPIPVLRLDTARRADVDVALCNCIAFGSKNSAIVVRRC